MFFDNVPRGPPDVMYHLKARADNDLHPQKIDLGVGIYRNEDGRYHELQAVTQVYFLAVMTGLALTDPA
jgi:aspartate aminotransferase